MEAAIRAGEGLGEVAVFDADGTLWADDVGEDMFRWLLAQGRLLGGAPGRDLWAEYEAKCKASPYDGYGWLGACLAGLEERELEALAAGFYAEHYARKVFPAQRALVEALHEAGWEVWIVSGSPRWMVVPGALDLGIPRERVVGVEVAVEGGVLTDRVLEPVTCHQGKVEAIGQRIGKRPRLAAGNAMTDHEMLCLASDVVLTVNPGPALTARAGEAGWVIERWGHP
jgi:phosphoserine phosphatase